MKLIEVSLDQLILSPELSRSGSYRPFEERLRSSIEEIGLAEPLKIAEQPGGGYVVIDGTMRLRAMRSIRAKSVDRFATISAYLIEYDKRYELRYQSDIYQDLLPSQLAALVEHLHSTENVLKADIARYIGVSPATLRNYTGLWRLLQRGGLFAKIVSLMDEGVIPASNPYAWLRLTKEGLRTVMSDSFSDQQDADTWVEETIASVRQGMSIRFPIKYVEAATDSLPSDCYRVGEEVRAVKRDLGLRRGSQTGAAKPTLDYRRMFRNLSDVSTRSSDPVLRSAAKSLQEYLK